jgi:hypothetical protein
LIPPSSPEAVEPAPKTEEEGHLQRMGGKEERVSAVGRAREALERVEREGEPRYDVAPPGPSSEELIDEPKGPPLTPEERIEEGPVSAEPRADAHHLEPEDTTVVRRRDESLRAKLRRQPMEQLPSQPGDEPDVPGEAASKA